MIKKILFLSCLITFAIQSYSQTVYFSEGFELGIKPIGWVDSSITLSQAWRYYDGGFGPLGFNKIPTFPENAYKGAYNAVLQYNNSSSAITRLITKKINLEFAIKPELSFYHAQDQYGEDSYDKLRLWGRAHQDSGWVMLEEYFDTTIVWTERKLFLPSWALTKDFQLGFEGITNWGYGVCIDEINITERGAIPVHLEDVDITQASVLPVPTATSYNPILRIRLKVYGNTGELFLDSLVANSLNTLDDDVNLNGVNLFLTESDNFNPYNQINSSISINAGKIIFNNLNYQLPLGYSYLWITYDIASNAVSNNLTDAFIPEKGIKVRLKTDNIPPNPSIWFNSTTVFYVLDGGDTLSQPIIKYAPETNISPDGSREIFPTLFYDNFSTDKGWNLLSEFEIDTPKGKGDTIFGYADPKNAFIGTKVLGLDLNNDGNYSKNISSDIPQTATSPTIDAYYYKSLTLSYYRQLNVEAYSDRAAVEVSSDNGLTWNIVWENGNFAIKDFAWVQHVINLGNFNREKEMKIRFRMGSTDGTTEMSGWNIDNLAIVGDHIENDAAVTKWVTPFSKCGHTANDTVKVWVKNLGDGDITKDIPVVCVFSGAAQQILNDTIKGGMLKGDSLLFSFKQTINLSTPYYYDSTEIYAYTNLEGDEYPENDRKYHALKAIPTYQPLYANDLESNNGFWYEATNTNLWQWGMPNGLFIKNTYSGSNAWMTGLDVQYQSGDSAYLESPCYNFTGVDYPVFEFYYRTNTEENTDGTALYYSTNNGVSWQFVPKHSYSFAWNWYNSPAIAALNNSGWDGTTATYKQAKQFLPSAVANQPSVRFRIGFEADSNANVYDGFAFDNLSIYDAPLDLGVDTILSPQSDCELSATESVKIAIRNHGVFAIPQGDTFMIAIKVDENQFIRDTALIPHYVAVGDTFHYAMKNTINLYQAGTYKIKAFTISKMNDNIYADTAYVNDSAYKTIIIRKPFVELGNNIYTVHPDTVVLDASAGADIKYVWKKNLTNDTISTDSTYNVAQEGVYNVILTDLITFCVANDTVTVNRLIADVGVDSIVLPKSDCEIGDSIPLTVRIKNFGTDTIRANYPIDVFYSINNIITVKESFIASETVYPNETFEYTFDSLVNFTDVKVYDFKCFTQYIDDDTTHNDTSNIAVEVYGYPAFDLQPDDTIHRGFTFLLNAAQGDASLQSFFWFDPQTLSTSTDSTYLVTNLGSGIYYATVTDVHNCSSADSARVRIVIPSVGVASINKPDTTCGQMLNKQLQITIKNTGTDTLWTGEKFEVGYKIQGMTEQKDTVVITTNFYPNDTLLFTFDTLVNISIYGKYNLDAYTLLAYDSVRTDDTLQHLLGVYPKPTIWLGNDTTVYGNPAYQIIPPSGFESYLWQDGDTNKNYTVTTAKTAPSVKLESSVIATDSNGCKATDYKTVFLSYRDIALERIDNNDTVCSIDGNEPIRLWIKNRGADFVLKNVIVNIKYKYNENTIKDTAFKMPYTLYVMDSVLLTLPKNQTFADMGYVDFYATTSYLNDIIKTNDTIRKSIYQIGRPEIIWTHTGDTIRTKEFPFTLTLGSTYNAYMWDDATTLNQREVLYPGKYTLQVTDDMGCNGYDTVVVINTIGIQGISNDLMGIIVYPKPASNILNISTKQLESEIYDVKILNDLGQVIYVDVLRNNNLQIDVNSWAKGIYYINISSDNKHWSDKIIIQ